jgi:hypothetical protein
MPRNLKPLDGHLGNGHRFRTLASQLPKVLTSETAESHNIMGRNSEPKPEAARAQNFNNFFSMTPLMRRAQ